MKPSITIRQRFSEFAAAASATAVPADLRHYFLLASIPPEHAPLATPSPAGKWVMEVPLMGSVPAGHPDPRSERFDGMIYVDMEAVRLPKGARTFALRVNGDSMIGRHIQDGDLVVLEQGMEARHGDVVAALIDGQCTLKTFVCRDGRAFLRAENPRYPDLIPAAELVIQGVMRALVRNPPRRV